MTSRCAHPSRGGSATAGAVSPPGRRSPPRAAPGAGGGGRGSETGPEAPPGRRLHSPRKSSTFRAGVGVPPVQSAPSSSASAQDCMAPAAAPTGRRQRGSASPPVAPAPPLPRSHEAAPVSQIRPGRSRGEPAAEERGGPCAPSPAVTGPPRCSPAPRGPPDRPARAVLPPPGAVPVLSRPAGSSSPPRRVRRGLQAGGARAVGRCPGHGGARSPAAPAELPVPGSAAEAAGAALAAALFPGLAAAGPDGRADRGAHRRAAGAGLRRGGRAASAGGWQSPAAAGARGHPLPDGRPRAGGVAGRAAAGGCGCGAVTRPPSREGAAGGCWLRAGCGRWRDLGTAQPSLSLSGGGHPTASGVVPLLLLSPYSTASILPSWAPLSTASWALPRT